MNSAWDPWDYRETAGRTQGSASMVGYHVHATDGDIGHVEDLLIDPARWIVSHFVIDTKNWWPGTKVVVPTSKIAAIVIAPASVRAFEPTAGPTLLATSLAPMFIAM